MRKIVLPLILFMCTQPAIANVDAELNNQMAELMRVAIDRSPQATQYRQALEKYARSGEKGKSGTKDVGLNYFGLPRGLDASIEGAQLVLDQPETVKHQEAAECWMQIENDRLHRQLCAAILRLASGLGTRDARKSRDHNSAALRQLEDLVGSEQAAKVAESIISWTQSARLSDTAFRQTPLNFSEVKERADRAAAMAEHNDFSIIALKNKLHHFGDHTNAKRRTSKLVEGTVTAVAMFGPGFGTPVAAHTVGAMWGVSNGGSEESKLLKELYYQRQIDSRRTALRDEAHEILLARQDAIREKNLPLLVCSEAMLAQLVGAIGIPQILAHPVLNHGTFAQQTIANTGPGN